MLPVRLVSWALVVSLLLFGLATYGSLPDRIPTGLDLNGRPRGLTEKSLLFWLLIPLLTLGIHVMLEVIRALLPHKPQLFNFPEKERFLALPGRYRPPVLDAMRVTLDAIMLVVQLPMFVVQYAIWQSAIGNPSGGIVVFTVIGGIFIGPVILLVGGRVTTATDEAYRRWQGDGAPAD